MLKIGHLRWLMKPNFRLESFLSEYCQGFRLYLSMISLRQSV
jgi:hypothetical protein